MTLNDVMMLSEQKEKGGERERERGEESNKNCCNQIKLSFKNIE